MGGVASMCALLVLLWSVGVFPSHDHARDHGDGDGDDAHGHGHGSGEHIRGHENHGHATPTPPPLPSPLAAWKGKSVDAWLTQHLSGDEWDATDAEAEILAIGEPAVGPLLQWLRSGTPTQRNAAIFLLAKLGPVSMPHLEHALRWDSTIPITPLFLAIERSGEAASSAVDAICALITDGPPGLPGDAMRVLGRIGPPAEHAVPLLLRYLRDGDSGAIRKEAAAALAGIKPQTPAAIDGLAAALIDTDENVREAAAIALREIGPAAASAKGALEKAASTSDASTRKAATEALAAIGR
jgi:HEAT repeat protein